jgi:predicted RND superfamily exporter protein
VVAATLLVVNRLGATLAIGVGYSFIAAMWMVPAIVVLEERFKDKFIRGQGSPKYVFAIKDGGES